MGNTRCKKNSKHQERIRVDKIVVKNLFGRFNYDIDLRNGENISVLIAPNGCGKTTIFSIVTFILKPKYQTYQKVRAIPFDECCCELSNKKKIVLTPRIDELPNRNRMAHEYGSRNGNLELAHTSSRELNLTIGGEIHEYHSNNSSRFIETDTRMGSFIANLEYQDMMNIELPGLYREAYDFYQQFEANAENFLIRNGCYLRDEKGESAVNFISADRLHSNIVQTTVDNFRYRRLGYELPDSVPDPIEKAQNDTVKLIRNMQEEYSALQTDAKDKLPQQYLKGDIPIMDSIDFMKRWKQYVYDVEKFKEIGLLDHANLISDKKQLEKFYEEKGAFLSVYLDLFSKTLEPFERNYQKLKLFSDIFNARNEITHKSIKYSKEGIVLSVDGEPLPLRNMSSGEKNDFVMFYDFIFNTCKGGIVFIDEPEISLHINWQETYLDILLEICNMNDIQAIVATHSPYIINGHSELYAKRGIKNELGTY